MALVSHSVRLIAVTAVALAVLSAQEFTPLSRFAERIAPEMRPALEGQRVRIRGVVAVAPLQLPNYQLISVQDEHGSGVALDDPGPQFRDLGAGDRVEVEGVVGARAGLSVIRPDTIRKTGSGPPPGPQRFEIRDLLRFENLARYVDAEATVLSVGANAGGDVMILGDSGASLAVFLPRVSRDPARGFQQFEPGDRVRVVGVTSQYSPLPPHDRNYQIIIRDISAVRLISEAWPVPPRVIVFLVVTLSATIVIFWSRERVLHRQRRILRGIISLSEEVVAAASAREIAQKLHRDLPRVVDGGEADLLLFKSADDTLVRVVSEAKPQPLTVPLDAPIGTLQGAMALCLRNRALLRIPDTHKSPIINRDEPNLPTSALFIPTFAQGELMGVLAVYSRRRIDRSADVDIALQHLGNQIAASLHLQERQQMRDQLLRSEKMAATGQLISGLAKDLRAPLETIGRAARDLATKQRTLELKDIASEAGRGLEMIDHLLSFSRMEHRDAKPLDIHALISSLVDLRAEERERKGVKCENSLPVSAVRVLADRSQLEQALLTILVHAEHSASESPAKSFQVTSRLVGRKVLVTFEAERIGSADSMPPPTLGDYFGFPVAQVIAQGHGGDLRSVRPRGAIRLELELPVHDNAASAPAAAPKTRTTRMLTCLLVEPDIISQRKLVAMLAARGHRSIPAATAEEAADLVQRMYFDVIFCASHLPGLTWMELYQRIRRRIGAFGLLSDTWDAEAAETLRSGEGRVLTRPVEERDLDDFLGLVEVRLAAARS